MLDLADLIADCKHPSVCLSRTSTARIRIVSQCVRQRVDTSLPTERNFSDGGVGVDFVELFVVPLSASVARQPHRADSFPHVQRHRFAGVELDASAVALQEFVPEQRQVAMQKDAFEILEEFFVGESNLDFGGARLDRVVAGVEQLFADRRLSWSEDAWNALRIVRRRTHRRCDIVSSIAGDKMIPPPR